MPLAAADFIACGAVPALIASTIRLAMVFSLSASLWGQTQGQVRVFEEQVTLNQAAIQLFVSIKSLSNEVVEHVPGDVGQAEISTAVMVSEFGVVDP